MKILMLTPYAPYPPNSGGRIRMWEQINYLGQRHDLTLVSFVASQEEYWQRKLLTGSCQQAVMVRHPQQLPTANLQELLEKPHVFQWYDVPAMTKTLEELQAQNFDVAIIEHIYMAQYHRLFPMPTILQEHNIESDIYKQLSMLDQGLNGSSQKQRAFLRATWMLMARYENETWPKFPLRVTVSDQDKQRLDRRCSTGRTVVIENGINTRAIEPVENEGSRKILFMGTMNYEPNVDGALYCRHEIMPKIWQKDPTISLVIAGRDPTPAVRALVATPQVEVIANPEDMSDVAKECCLTVVPLRSGGGSRIKIPHSMAMGLPVVSTTIGCEGLTVTDGQDILIRDDPGQFSEAVVDVVSDPALQSRLRTAGRQLVEDRYDWSRMFEQLEAEMQILADSARA